MDYITYILNDYWEDFKRFIERQQPIGAASNMKSIDLITVPEIICEKPDYIET